MTSDVIIAFPVRACFLCNNIVGSVSCYSNYEGQWNWEDLSLWDHNHQFVVVRRQNSLPREGDWLINIFIYFHFSRYIMFQWGIIMRQRSACFTCEVVKHGIAQQPSSFREKSRYIVGIAVNILFIRFTFGQPVKYLSIQYGEQNRGFGGEKK